MSAASDINDLDALNNEAEGSSSSSSQASLVSSSQGTLGSLLMALTRYMMVTRSWSWWLLMRSGRLAWMVGTTLFVMAVPMLFQVQRENDIILMEQAKVQEMQAQGFTRFQIDDALRSGQLGIPPPPPKPPVLD